MKKKVLCQLWVFMLLFTAVTHAQKMKITGLVTDVSGTPLSNVSVLIKGNSASTLTDVNGSFGLEANKGAVLMFSYTGAEPVSYVVKDESFLKIEITVKARDLENVVVIGYGSQKKKDITSAISTISTKDISSRPITNTAEILQGKAAGVQVIQPSGEPGGDFSVRVRGISSPNGSEPLYVIDGVIALNTKSLDPNSIESISVLKDASAAGIYGAAGAINGVVLITTKKGVKGKPKTELHLYTGIQQITDKIAMLDGPQSADLLKDAYSNVGLPFNISDSAVNSVNNNWQDLIYRNAKQTGLSAGFSGGSDKGQYYLGVGYINQEGIMKNSDRTRYYIKLNLEQSMNNWLSVGTHVAYNRSNGNIINGLNNSQQHGGAVLAALNINPFVPVYSPGTTYYGAGLDGSYTALKDIYAGSNTGVFNNLLGDVHAEVKLPYNLSLRTQFGVNFENNNNDYFESPSSTMASFSNGGYGSNSSGESFRYTWENTLTYSKSFDKQTINAVIGTSAINEKYRTNYSEGKGFATGYVPTLNAATSNYALNGYKSEYATASYFGRVAYSYDSKYLLTASIRRDGASRFGSNNTYGHFPAVSVGWKVSNENFMKDVTFIQDLKLRAGYGATGNLPPVNYPSVNTLSPASALLGGRVVSGYLPTNPIGNPDLKWESGKGVNAGVDFNILNNRVTISADYYNKKTTDLIFQKNLPSTTGSATGTPYTYVNLPGVVLNAGFDLSVNANIVSNKNFSWNSNLNLSFNKNRISGLDSGSVYYTGGIAFGGNGNPFYPTIIKNGLPLGTFWGYVADGVNPSTGDIDYRKLSNGSHVDGKNVNSDSDRTSLGSGLPTFTYGFSNEFKYNNFSLNILVDGVSGNKIFNANRIETEGMSTVGNATAATIRRWKKSGDNTDIPRAAYGDPNNNTLISSRFIENGAFTRIKSATLSYLLKSDRLQNIGIQGLRFYVTGTNLLTITKYKGYYPEINAFGTSSQAIGIDYGTYPQTKTYTIGINIEL
jgi:TonB-linked SusC/RagA family outer membrane protein